jgi:hypothetical protein
MARRITTEAWTEQGQFLPKSKLDRK